MKILIVILILLGLINLIWIDNLNACKIERNKFEKAFNGVMKDNMNLVSQRRK